MPIGVTYGLVTGISEAITPAGFAYLTMPFSGNLLDDAHALLPQRVAEHAHAPWRGASARGLPMPLSSTLILASLVAVFSLPPAQAIAWHSAIDRCLIVILDGAHRARARVEQVLRVMPASSGVIGRVPRSRAATSVTFRCSAVARRRRPPELDPHRLLARVFLEHFGAQSGDAADDEQELADQRRETEVDQDRRERAVDIQRDRLDALAHRRFEREREADAVAGNPASSRQREQHRDARIDRDVHAMSETGQPPLRRLGLVDHPRRGRVERSRFAPRSQARRDQLHAAEAGAAVLVADGQDAGGDCRRRRLPVARRRETRRRARRRPGAVVGDADQDRVEQPPLRRARAAARGAAER